MPKILPILGILFLTACASKPQLYPNHKFKTVGKEAAKKDIDQCIADADEYLKSSKGKNITKGAGAAGALSPDQVKHRFVNQCLADKGYQVIGWD
jgi:hypothetical protein